MPSISSASPDIAVIGGGVAGLWTAYRAARQGLSVILLEKHGIGAGASGGVMGALMPHQPTGWNEKKQFQLVALVSLEAEIAELEAFTGLSAGYRRCGRVMPIRNAEKRRQSTAWTDASEQNWPEPYRWRVIDRSPDANLLPQDEMPFGANTDNLSARLDPRGLLAALADSAVGGAVLSETGRRMADREFRAGRTVRMQAALTEQAAELARTAGLSLGGLDSNAAHWTALVENGQGDLDISSLILEIAEKPKDLE